MVTGKQIAELALTQVDPSKKKIVYLKAGQGNKVTASWLASYRKKYGEAPYVGAEADIGKIAYDCSGLVTWILKKLGVNTDNATHNPAWYQANEIKATKDQLQAGMLCFKLTDGRAHHVGICVGNNEVVEAKGRQWGVVKTTGAASWDAFRMIKNVTYDTVPTEPKPGPKPVTPPATEDGLVKKEVLYIIRPGDTLSQIARDCGTSVEVLAEINDIANPNLIRAGKKLVVDYQYMYKIKAGDTLSGIAKRYGATVAFLAELNSIPNPSLIRAGKTIRIR